MSVPHTTFEMDVLTGGPHIVTSYHYAAHIVDEDVLPAYERVANQHAVVRLGCGWAVCPLAGVKWPWAVVTHELAPVVLNFERGIGYIFAPQYTIDACIGDVICGYEGMKPKLLVYPDGYDISIPNADIIVVHKEHTIRETKKDDVLSALPAMPIELVDMIMEYVPDKYVPIGTIAYDPLIFYKQNGLAILVKRAGATFAIMGESHCVYFTHNDVRSEIWFDLDDLRYREGPIPSFDPSCVPEAAFTHRGYEITRNGPDCVVKVKRLSDGWWANARSGTELI